MNELNIERKKERQIISRKKELMQSLIDKVKEGWKKERNRSNNVSKKERMEYLAKMIKCIQYIKQSIKEEKKLPNKDQNDNIVPDLRHRVATSCSDPKH